MRHALMLAQRGLGNVWPNPAVGCIIVNHGAIVGRGWTQPSGRPHAEVVALQHAGDKALGATAYVTLEPCSHHGKTPPCANALITAGIKRVVVACSDPDPRVNGNGIQMLREAGIQVDIGLCESEALKINAGFISRIQNKRPIVHLKVATTIDGYMASCAGHSQWITGGKAREEGHRIRSEHDAILVGSGTVNADDPMLNVRLPGMHHRQPIRIILEGKAPVSASAQIWDTVDISPVWLITARDDAKRNQKLESKGVRCIRILGDSGGRPSLPMLLELLAEEGITRLLLEAGSHLNAAFLKAGFVDRVYWFRAPTIMGGDGLAGIGGMHLAKLDELPQFTLTRRLPLDRDVLEDYQRHI